MKRKARSKTTRTRGRPVSVDPARSATMRAVGSRGTTPELLVRQTVRRLGYRARYNSPTLPGKPDIVILSQRKVIFVHGCFWHGHSCARGDRVPRANRAYWVRKVSANRRRHRIAVRALHELGWFTLTLWECQLHDTASLSRRIGAFLGSPQHPGSSRSPTAVTVLRALGRRAHTGTSS